MNICEKKERYIYIYIYREKRFTDPYSIAEKTMHANNWWKIPLEVVTSKQLVATK